MDRTQFLITLLISALVGLFFAQKINLFTADLGRHIKNGEVVLHNTEVLYSNFYSYTDPNFKTINHHWLFGVLVNTLYQVGGFNLISVAYVIVNAAAFLLIFLCARKLSNTKTALIISLVSIPLLTSRTEVRPEGLSYLFFGLYLYVFLSLKGKSPNFWRALVILPIIQTLWVNTHIFFVFGIFISGVFLLDVIVENRKDIAKYVCLLLTTTLASLVNPFFLRGLEEPFSIFREYGYQIVENQTLFFIQKRFGLPIYVHFEIFFLLGIALSTAYILTAGKKFRRSYVVIFLIVFGLLTFKINRILQLYGFVFIPCASFLIFQIKNKLFPKINIDFALISAASLILVSSLIQNSYFSPFRDTFGLGLMENTEKAAEFFLGNHIKGPIFNNYDIGGYLIFNLFPEYRVFVDNRPEAYSVDFFNDAYIPMQEDENIWEKEDAKYNFNAIFFYRQDITPWAQPFLIRRIKDKDWAPVYVDDFSIILVKNSMRNEEIIHKYKLPDKTFKISKGTLPAKGESLRANEGSATAFISQKYAHPSPHVEKRMRLD